jgi:hypothetical protein
MRTLILNLKTWRCGGNTTISAKYNSFMGHGSTLMRNNIGYSCCLGQWAEQIITKEELTKITSSAGDPEQAAILLNRVYDPLFVYVKDGIYRNTNLAKRCMDINDDPHLPVYAKILALKEQLAMHDCELIITGGQLEAVGESYA